MTGTVDLVDAFALSWSRLEPEKDVPARALQQKIYFTALTMATIEYPIVSHKCKEGNNCSNGGRV